MACVLLLLPPPSTEWDISVSASYRSDDHPRLDVSLILSDTLYRLAAIMLDLTQAYTGCPSSSLQFLHLPRETLLVGLLLYLQSSAGSNLACHQLYPFADSVVVLNARTLAFVRALAFWEVYPSTRHLAQSVQCLAVENGMKLVRNLSLLSVLSRRYGGRTLLLNWGGENSRRKSRHEFAPRSAASAPLHGRSIYRLVANLELPARASLFLTRAGRRISWPPCSRMVPVRHSK